MSFAVGVLCVDAHFHPDPDQWAFPAAAYSRSRQVAASSSCMAFTPSPDACVHQHLTRQTAA